jgi:hypothetical protein
MAITGKAITIPADVEIVDTSAMSFAELLDTSAMTGFLSIPGYTVVDQWDVIGVPFIITGLRWQKPVADKSRSRGFRDYVSLECVAADKATIAALVARGRISKEGGVVVTDLAQMFLAPEERFIINDGSTGIRRQLVKMLSHPRVGLIDVGNSDDAEPADIACNSWASMGEQTWVAADGTILPYITRQTNGAPLIIHVRRGLHASAYTNEYGDNVTFYLG